jgi:hypothetical protein
MEVKLLEKTGGKSGHWINPKWQTNLLI